MPGAQPGRDVVYSSPQASSAVLGLGTPLTLEIQKFMLKGVATASGWCWGSAWLVVSLHIFPGGLVLPLTLSLEEGKG